MHPEPPEPASAAKRPDLRPIEGSHLAQGARRVMPTALVFAPYAGFVTRALAMIVDLLIITVALTLSGVAINFFVRTSGISQLARLLMGDLALPATFMRYLLSTGFELVVALIVSFLYFSFFYSFGGATLGKYIFGLRVVSADGGRIHGAQASLRVLAYAVSALALYLGFLAVLVDDRRRGWHDRIARTVVVHTWQARPDENFLRRALDKLK